MTIKKAECQESLTDFTPLPGGPDDICTACAYDDCGECEVKYKGDPPCYLYGGCRLEIYREE